MAGFHQQAEQSNYLAEGKTLMIFVRIFIV